MDSGRCAKRRRDLLGGPYFSWNGSESIKGARAGRY